jgi:hypothetical protein
MHELMSTKNAVKNFSELSTLIFLPCVSAEVNGNRLTGYVTPEMNLAGKTVQLYVGIYQSHKLVYTIVCQAILDTDKISTVRACLLSGSLNTAKLRIPTP